MVSGMAQVPSNLGELAWLKRCPADQGESARALASAGLTWGPEAEPTTVRWLRLGFQP